VKAKLTKSAIDQAEYRGSQYESGSWSRCVIWDTLLPGFGLRVVPSGRKFFILKYRTGGRGRFITIGEYGPLTVGQARARASQYRGDIELNEADPLEDRLRRKGKCAATVGKLCEDYLERHARVHKKSWRKDASRIQRHILPNWKSRPLASITRDDVSRLHQKIGEKAPYEANRVLEQLRKMFNLAADWGDIDDNAPNPARRVKKFKEKQRDRWVKPTELPRLAKSIDEEDNVYVRAALWLYLLTGVRKSELLRARWEHVDFEQKELRIPETKSGEAHNVPLSSEAVAILREVPQLSGNPFMLPGRMEGRHLVNIDKNWRRVRDAAGVPDVRLHDLRRTVGSMLAQSGTSLLIIQKALGHSTPAATQVYARLSQDPVREALEQHGKRLMVAAGKREAGGVIDFEEAKRG